MVFIFNQCCGSRMFIPDPNFFHPGSQFKKIPDPGSGSLSKNLSILTPKIVSPGFGSMRFRIRESFVNADPDPKHMVKPIWISR